MKRFAALTFTLLLVWIAAPLDTRGVPQAPPASKQAKDAADDATKQFSAFMRMKLEKSKQILEGLSLENYELVERSAKQLKLYSMESGWNAIQTNEYTMQSRDFRRACDVIVAAASEQDINRAALGYVALTVRCVECHSYMRHHQN